MKLISIHKLENAKNMTYFLAYNPAMGFDKRLIIFRKNCCIFDRRLGYIVPEFTILEELHGITQYRNLVYSRQRDPKSSGVVNTTLAMCQYPFIFQMTELETNRYIIEGI